MDLRFVVPDLRKLDAIRGEALGVGIFSDLRPLRGAAGLVDWRLGGFLSRHLRAGRLTGELGECVLAPTGGRLSFEKVVLVGLGPHEAFDAETFESSTRSLVEALRAAHVRTALVALPGRAERRIEAADAIERFLRTLSDAAEPDEITLVETIEGQKEMEPVLAREQRRARAFAP